ncbi:hypothetical protein ALC57_15651 [Trachymyrmex cornetzi]|uniref:Uncharacterized protein n=1 Tax=Trachymyrmex cornetzi TaxID=471704 RepID=A0A151IWI5_9HYME|nr:hypothetical protein ALC57_15651 [Trachymyrmex cornetzi]
MISPRAISNVETYMLLQFFFVSYDALLSLAKYIFNLTVNAIPYGLYFDCADDEELVGDFNAFSLGHSQYLGFSFDCGGGLGGPCFNDSMSTYTASKVSMYMRSRSSSRSTFHSHVRFSRPLTYTIWESQSMVISTQPESAGPIASCQKFPWHGTRKHVMRENSPLFQHRHFLHDKFLINEESLQIHERWYEHIVEKTVIEKTVVDCSVS